MVLVKTVLFFQPVMPWYLVQGTWDVVHVGPET